MSDHTRSDRFFFLRCRGERYEHRSSSFTEHSRTCLSNKNVANQLLSSPLLSSHPYFSGTADDPDASEVAAPESTSAAVETSASAGPIGTAADDDDEEIAVAAAVAVDHTPCRHDAAPVPVPVPVPGGGTGRAGRNSAEETGTAGTGGGIAAAGGDAGRWPAAPYVR